MNEPVVRFTRCPYYKDGWCNNPTCDYILTACCQWSGSAYEIKTTDGTGDSSHDIRQATPK